VRVADGLTCRHVGRYLYAFIERLQALIALATDDFSEAHFSNVGAVLLVLCEAALYVGDTEDSLKSCVDPTGSILITKAKGSGHSYFWKAEKLVRNGTGSVLKE
jgi:hypothetical protein